MGTIVSVDVAGVDAKRATAAINDVWSEIERLGREWYAWRSESELARLNTALANGEGFTPSAELLALLRRSKEAFATSEGCFDPAIAPMVELWGFHQNERDAKRPYPDKDQLSAWQKQHATLADLTIDADQVRSGRRDLKLDLGAIAKGFIVDLAIERLRAKGITDALINAGGNLRGIGLHRGESRAPPWRIEVASPRGRESIGWLELQGDEGVATSGDYERFAMVDGKLAHHLLDPRTGEPALHTRAVTVIAGDAATADAASTALFIAGPEHWKSLARAFKLTSVLRVDAEGRIEVSGQLAARLHATSEPRQIPWTVVDL